MLKKLKLLFTSSVRIGVAHAKSFPEAKRIMLTNALCFIYMGLSIPYALFFVWVKLPNLGIAAVVTITFFSFSIYLNYKGKQPLAGFVLIVVVTLAVYIFSSILGPQCGVPYIFFPLMVTPSVVFNHQQRFLSYSCMIIIALLYLGAEFFNYPFFYHSYMTQHHYWLMRLGLIVDTLIILFVIVYFHLEISTHLDKMLNYFLQLNHLTARESEVAVKVVQGLQTKDISIELFIEESTVKTHLKNVYRKLNVKNRAHLIDLLSL